MLSLPHTILDLGLETLEGSSETPLFDEDPQLAPSSNNNDDHSETNSTTTGPRSTIKACAVAQRTVDATAPATTSPSLPPPLVAACCIGTCVRVYELTSRSLPARKLWQGYPCGREAPLTACSLLPGVVSSGSGVSDAGAGAGGGLGSGEL